MNSSSRFVGYHFLRKLGIPNCCYGTCACRMHCSNVDGASSNRSLLGVCVGGVSDELLIASVALAALRPCNLKNRNDRKHGQPIRKQGAHLQLSCEAWFGTTFYTPPTGMLGTAEEIWATGVGGGGILRAWMVQKVCCVTEGFSEFQRTFGNRQGVAVSQQLLHQCATLTTEAVVTRCRWVLR